MIEGSKNRRIRAVYCALALAATVLALPAAAAVIVDDFDDGTLDPAWTLEGIGNANQEVAVEEEGILKLTADGATAFFGADNAGFLYRSVTGNFRMEITIDGTTMLTGGQYRKAGLMVRTDLDPLAQRLLALLVPYWENADETHLQFVGRETVGGRGSLRVADDIVGVPRVVRLAIDRVGETLSVEYSIDGGSTWIQPTTGMGGSITIPGLADTLLVGPAMVSNNISVTSTAHFDDFSLAVETPPTSCAITGVRDLAVPSPPDNARYGSSVAFSGALAVVGARLYSGTGAAFLYRRIEMNLPFPILNYVATLAPRTSRIGDNIGSAVAVHGQTVMVGATTRDPSGLSSGSVFVFSPDENGDWKQNQELVASDGASPELFGRRIQIDGATAAIASLDSGDGSPSGAVYVFTREAVGQWVERQKIIPSDVGVEDQFGRGLAVDGDTMLIGSLNGEVGVKAGAVYVFLRDEAGIWREHQKIVATDATSGDGFGVSLALDGDTAFVGASQDDGEGVGAGSVYVLRRDGTSLWKQTQKLTVNPGANSAFGVSVALEGDRAIIGAPGADGVGGAYAFFRDSNGTWQFGDSIFSSKEIAQFGTSVAMSGSVGLVGAPGLGAAVNPYGDSYHFFICRDN